MTNEEILDALDNAITEATDIDGISPSSVVNALKRDGLAIIPDPKAPLPDGVEKAIDFVSDAFRHEFREAKSDPDEPYFCALKTIRTHIAAQAEKIAELEAENKRLREALVTAKLNISLGLQNVALEKIEAALAQTDNGK